VSFRNKAALLGLKLKVSAVAVSRVLIKPHYFAGMIIFVLLAANLVIWSLNFELAQFIIIDSGLPVADKLRFFSTSVRDIFTTYESNQALGIAVFSVLFGINMSMLVFVLNNIGLKKMAKQSGASGAGLVFAVISGGCVACGASLLPPLPFHSV